MFFRREKPREISFEERLQTARLAGFEALIAPGDRVRFTRDGCVCLLENTGAGLRWRERPGIEMGEETGVLVDRGFQKFFVTPSGRSQPATAEQLRRLHRFQEDLREALGQISLYNESLGTVSEYYLYDRVENRDAGVPKRVWEK